MNVLAVMVGGFLGGVCRYVLGERLYTESGFPFGTLCVNVAGCFFLGWLLTTVSQKSKVSRPLTLLGGTGFLGSFTTFSTFSAETVCLVRAGFVLYSVLYVIATVVFGLFASYTGVRLALNHRKGADTG